MSHPVNFRRAKLVKFINEQQKLIDETKSHLDSIGVASSDFVEHRETILKRLRQEFNIDSEE